ncbi:MAG TPA: SRPBCC family protein [Fibrobacteria bacterium]|nr:SRPBCC family protein [Fibrobacteria bacterium]
MKYLVRGIGGLIAAAAFVWLCGLLLPLEHEASATVRVNAPPEAVWAVLTAVKDYPRWRSDVAMAEIVALKPELSWKESDARGRVTWHAARGMPGGPADKWMDRILKGDPPQAGERTFLIVAGEDGGTRVAITEVAEVRDPLARFRARFVTGYAENLKKLLEDLRKRLAE